jgi:hypothetical protein
MFAYLADISAILQQCIQLQRMRKLFSLPHPPRSTLLPIEEISAVYSVGFTNISQWANRLKERSHPNYDLL